MPDQRIDQNGRGTRRHMLSDLEALNEVEATPKIERLGQISSYEVCLGYSKTARGHVLTVYTETLRDTAAAPFCGPDSSATAYVDNALRQHPQEEVGDHYVYERTRGPAGARINEIKELVVVLVGHSRCAATRPTGSSTHLTPRVTIPQMRMKY